MSLGHLWHNICHQLEHKIRRLQQKLADGDRAVSEASLQVKTELQCHHLDEMDAITTKTKIKYTEEGEKSTRYFYSLENHQKSKLLTKNNLKTITESYAFCKDLYSAQQINPAKQADFLNIATPTLMHL